MSATEFALAKSYLGNLRLGVTNRADLALHESEYGQSDGLVYFIGVGGEYITHVKIGYTRHNPYARMRDLQTGCPFRMELLGYVLGNQDMERELHSVLGEFCTSGEWFEYSEYVSRIISHKLNSAVIA